MAESRFSAAAAPRKRSPKKARTARTRAENPESSASESEEATTTRKSSTTDKRERILRAAVKVFARKGFYASRVSEIARAAGVADGTIYLYFKSKDEVLTSLFEDRITRLLAVLRDELAKFPTAEEKLRRLIEMQLGLLDGERELAEVVTVNLRQSTKLLKQFAARRFTEYLELMATVVAEGQRAGAFRTDVSPRIMARMIFGALDGIAMTWALGSAEQGGLKRAATQLAEVMLAGLRALPRAENA